MTPSIKKKEEESANIWTITFLLISITLIMNLDYLIANRETMLEMVVPQSQMQIRAQRELHQEEIQLQSMEQIKKDSIFKNDLVVTVITGRGSADRRQAIRESWGKGESDIYFIVGKHCPYPPEDRATWDGCERASNGTASPEWREKYLQQEMALTEQLLKEENVIMVDMIDTYKDLAHKIKLAYKWVTDHGDPKWILKIDDDAITTVQTLERHLHDKYDDIDYLYMGWINKFSPVMMEGKWADPLYAGHKYYPPYANGCSGYVVSHKIAEYIVENSDELIEYHNEDATVGIWINEAPWSSDVVIVQEANRHWYANHDGMDHCFQNQNGIVYNRGNQYFVVGHKLSASRMKQCFNELFGARH